MPVDTLRSPDEIERAFEVAVPALLRQVRVPGLSLALVHAGAVAWVRGFGQVRTGRDEPVTPQTRFQAASLGKPVYAGAVLRLAERGQLDLGAPLSAYLPTPYVADDPLLAHITARSVLAHTTGWPNWRRRGHALMRERAPNSAFGYSGEGYMYLQHVVEHLSGQPLEVCLRELVFGPLGMTSSTYCWAAPDDPAMAVGHDRRGRARRPLVEERPLAAASLHTTAHDLAHFVCALFAADAQPAWLQAASIQDMLRPYVQLNEHIAWGLGWGLQTTTDGEAFWHWGDNPGYKGFVLAYPAARLGLVMLANGDNGLALCDPLLHLAFRSEYPALTWLAGFYGLPSFGVEQ